MRAQVLVVGLVVAIAAGLFVRDGFRSLRMTDVKIEARAPEDTLGFGIYPMLSIFGLPPILALAWLWKRVGHSRARAAAVGLLVLLGSSIVFNVWAYNILRARVLR